MSRVRAAPEPAAAALQIALLLSLTIWVFAGELADLFRVAALDADGAHVLAMPILLLALVARRRRLLRESVGAPSIWGVVLLVLGVLVMVAATWPFNHGLPRRQAMVIVMAGAVLAAGGRRLLYHCLPMLLLVLMMIPLGARLSAQVMAVPERLTVATCMTVMEMLPQVISLELRGSDLYWIATSGRGTILLGEPHRWSSLILPYLTLVVFLTFVRVRPLWQIVVMALAAGPIALACNFVRLMVIGLLTVYGHGHAIGAPTSPLPRLMAAVVSVPLAWVLAALTLALLGRIIEEPARGPAAPGPR